MKKRLTLSLVWILAAVAAVPAAAGFLQDAPIAVMMKVDGDVRLVQGEGEPQPAVVGARLQAGDRIVPASEGATAVVVFRSGQKSEITEESVIQAPSSSDRGDMFSRTVNVLAQAANSDARTSPNRQGMIRPIPGEPTKVAPRLGIKVESTRPTFVWRSFEDAGGYTIQIRREGEPPRRYQTEDTVFTLPEDEELERGTTYHWTVAPERTRRPAREDSLVVMSAEEHEQLEWSMEAIEEMGFDPTDDGRLLSAVVYTDHGLFYDAAEVLEEMRESGEVSADVLLLQGEVLDRIGEVEEAGEAFDEADERMR